MHTAGVQSKNLVPAIVTPLLVGAAVFAGAVVPLIFDRSYYGVDVASVELRVILAFLIVGGWGAYALARTFRVDHAWAGVVGVAAPLCGFTLYVAAPVWVNSLAAFSLVPWAWALTRRAVFQGKTPAWAVIGCAAVLVFGVSHATLAVFAVLAATIAEAAIHGRRTPLIRAVAVAALAATAAVLVWLPGFAGWLHAAGHDGIHNTGELTVDLSGIAASSTPVGTQQVTFFGAHFPNAPILYVAWFLPLLAFVRWRALARVRGMASIAAAFAAGILVAVMPSNVLGLHDPIRMMPFIALTLVLAVGLGLSRARVRTLTAPRVALASGWVLVASGITFSQGPQFVKVLVAVTAVSLPAILLVGWLITVRGERRGTTERDSSRAAKGLRWWHTVRGRRWPAALVVILGTVTFLIPQHYTSRSLAVPDREPVHLALSGAALSTAQWAVGAIVVAVLLAWEIGRLVVRLRHRGAPSRHASPPEPNADAPLSHNAEPASLDGHQPADEIDQSTPATDDLPPVRHSAWARTLWPLGVALVVTVAALIPPALFRTYYFTGDTQVGAYGQWYHIGARLLAGDWSVLNPTVWQAGAYLADGAWGLYSPILWVIGIAAHSVNDVLLLMNTVKISFLVLAALGVYRLARSFGAHPHWAAMVAVAAPFAGFTMYQDASSWVTGLMTWALLPHAWASMRSFAFHRTTIAGPILWGVSLLGITYTHATLMLGLAVAAVMVEAWLTDRAGFRRMIVAALILLCAAIIAHLPALLIYPVTARQGGISNVSRYTPGVSAILQSVQPFGTGRLYWTPVHLTGLPFVYSSWLLPLFVMVDWRRFGTLLKTRVSLLIMLAGTLVMIQLPSDFGPIRFPLRVYPYLIVVLLVMLAVGLSLAQPRPLTVRRLVGTIGVLSFSTYLVWGTSPKWWGSLLIGWMVVALAYFWYFLAIRRTAGVARANHSPAGAARSQDEQHRAVPGLGRHPRLRQQVFAAGAVLLTALLLGAQHVEHPTPGGVDFGLPTTLSTYQSILKDARGDVLVIGDALDDHEHARIPTEAVTGNSWYLTAGRVQNAYTTLQWPAYSKTLCISLKGNVCTGTYKQLFVPQPETGKMLVDLLGINSIYLVKVAFHSHSWQAVYPGWSIVSDTPGVRLLVRDTPVPNAGSVVSTTPGLQVRVTRETESRVDFEVIKAAASDGRVVLSRMPWPGYTVTGGTLGAATEGFLLTVDVPADAVGHTISVEYRPAGFGVMASAAVVIAALLVLWAVLTVLALIGRRRAWRPLRWVLSERGQRTGAPTQ